MKLPTRALAVVIVLAVLPAAANPQTSGCAFSSIGEYTRYESAGDTWVVLVAPEKLTRACLIDFASRFHQEYPEQQFELFDATGPELVKYVRWASAGVRESDLLPYPEKWIRKHQIASLQPMSDKLPCALWQLFDRDYNSLAQFDRVKCMQ
ncbi:MAG TPA: hypothetical protein DC047_15940 [Blastocatellia bacterium]|nr:hypothetical protein [Blastocatellia bacterium]